MSSGGPAPASPFFATTRWSLVVSARQDEDQPMQVRAALEELLAAYWYPLYAYLRRRGESAEDAQDIVQDFFATAVEKDYVGQADEGRGRFRGFLIQSLKNHASKLRDKAAALKRGGGKTILPLDFQSGEERWQREPAGGETPEHAYERQYAHTLLARARAALAEQCRRAGGAKAERYEVLAPYLTGEGGPSYRIASGRLGISETAVKVAVHRLRNRFRDILRAEVAETLDDAGDVDDEIQRLIAALHRT